MRHFLNGRFENSVFCLLDPSGQKWLTRASRGPEQVLGRSATQQMQQVAKRYPAKADAKSAIVPDFHSFRQALNVASADQRLLVLIHAPGEKEKALRESLRHVASNAHIIGRFHFDFDQSDKWLKPLQVAKAEPGIYLVDSGEFGMKGRVAAKLPLDMSGEALVAAMRKANHEYATATVKKVYSSHVAKGNSLGIYFEGAVPYGEDRDGDGEIDHRGGGPRGGPGGPRGQGASGPNRRGPR